MRKNVFRIRLDDKEIIVMREFASVYTGGNQAEALRWMIHSFGRSSHILTDQDVQELERSRYKKSTIPASY